MKDSNSPFSTLNLCHRFCLCHYHEDYVWTEPYEVRSVIASSFPTHGTLTHSERDTIYRIYSYGYIWDICNSTLLNMKNNIAYCDSRYYRLFDRDTYTGKKEVKIHANICIYIFFDYIPILKK